MLGISQLSAALAITLLPLVISAPFTPRAPGDSLNFDLKIWSTDPTLAVIPTDFSEGRTEQNLTATTNADYTAEGTEPDYKTPEGASEKYAIIGQMHFNEVPGDQGRKVYILQNQGKEDERGVNCLVTFQNNTGVEELFWYIKNEPPLDFPESFVDQENFHLVCNGDGGVVDESED